MCCAVVCCMQSAKRVFCRMKAAGAPVDLYLYKHCGHAFMNALTAGGRDKIKGEGGDPDSSSSTAVLSGQVSGVLLCCVRFMPLMHTHTVCCCAEVGQADPPTEEPQMAFDRIVTFFKEQLA